MRHLNMMLALMLMLAYVSVAQSATTKLENDIAQDVNEVSRSSATDIENLDPSERLFFTSNSLAFGGNGATSITVGNAGYVILGAYVLIPLIIGLALLFYLIGGQGDRYGGGDIYSGVGDGYAQPSSGYGTFARSFDPYAIDWEKFSILDWISIGEEAWRKFDPADLDCQKRLICEIHQNTSKFGVAANKMVDLFSYLQYAEVLSLPEEIKALVEEYLDAADRGRSLQKECGEVYSSCEFSVKTMVDKYSQNEI